jgi:DNA repair exonuclease SbcCD ATPase subunit
MEVAILRWIQTIDGLPSITSFNQLGDGTLLWQLFKKIGGTVSQEIQMDTATISPAVRKIFLQSLVKDLENFCTSNLQVDISPDTQKIDLDIIAQNDNTCKEYHNNLNALLQIFLYVATNGPKNAELNLKILTMNPEDQRVLMRIIEKKIQQYETLSTNANYNARTSPVKTLANLVLSSPVSRSLNDHRNLDGVANYKQLYESERAEVQTLIQQNQSLQDEKERLHQEKKEMLKEIRRLEECNNKLEQQYQQLTERFNELAERERRAENVVLLSDTLYIEKTRRENEELKEILFEKEKTITRLKSEISRISHYESEIQNLRDELDICREKVENVNNLETKLNKANIKLTQMQNLKQRVKKLEEDNEMLLREKVQLQETTQREITALRRKVECYEKQIFETSKQITQLEVINGQKEAEIAHLKVRYGISFSMYTILFVFHLAKERVTILEQEVTFKESKLKISKELQNNHNHNVPLPDSTKCTPMKSSIPLLPYPTSPDVELLGKALMTPSRKENVLKLEQQISLQTPPHLKQERIELNNRIEFLLQQYQQLQREYLVQNESLKQEFEAKNATIESLKNQISLNSQENQTLNEKITKNQNFTKKLEDSFRTKLHEYVEKLSVAENRIVELEAEKQILQKELETLKENKQQSQSTAIDSSCTKERIDLMTSTKRIEELKRQIEEQTKVIKDQQSKIEEQNKQLEELIQQCEQFKRLRNEETTKYEKEKQQMIEELTRTKSELQKTLREHLQLQTQLRQQLLQIEEHKRKQEKLNQECEKYRQLYYDLETQHRELLSSFQQNGNDTSSAVAVESSRLSAAGVVMLAPSNEKCTDRKEENNSFNDLNQQKTTALENIDLNKEQNFPSSSTAVTPLGNQHKDINQPSLESKNTLLCDKENDPSLFSVNGIRIVKEVKPTVTKSLGPAQRICPPQITQPTTHRLNRLAMKALATHGIRSSLQALSTVQSSCYKTEK